MNHLGLSPREQEVVRLVGKGLTNSQIGAELSISTFTVSSYMRRIFAKYGAHSRAQVIERYLAGRRDLELSIVAYGSTILGPITATELAGLCGIEWTDLLADATFNSPTPRIQVFVRESSQ